MASNTPNKAVVLVVEDEVLLRICAAEVIEEAGFKAIEAANAQEALVILQARDDVRIVITDVQMVGPDDGLVLAQEIRDRWPPVEIIITSGRAQVTDRDIPVRGLFIAKPYDAAVLIAALRQFTD